MTGLKTDIWTLISSLTGGEVVIWADQNSPRPALPYWTLRIIAIPTLGQAEYSQGVTNDGDQTIRRVTQATLAVQRYGTDSEIKCHALKSDMDKMSVREAWSLRDISCYDSGPVTNISTLLDQSKIEPRASVDLFLRFGSRVLDRVGIIETVAIDGEYTDTESDEVIQTVVASGNI